MQGVHEESVPLVDAHAAAAPTATDRAQHQSRRSSLKTTLAVGLACALLVAAAIVGKSRDGSNEPRNEGARAANKHEHVAALGGSLYQWTASGGGFSCLPAMSTDYPNAISDVTTDFNDGREHKITPRDCAFYQKLHPFAHERASSPSSCAPANTLFASIADSDNYEIAKLSTKRVQDQKCFMDRYILITTDAEATRKCKEEKLFHCLQYADGHAFDGLVHHGGHAEDKKYSVMTWFKQKVTLGLLAAGGIDFFFFDTDVILFKVPELALLVKQHPDANLFYQQGWVGYNAFYHGRYPFMHNHSAGEQHHYDAQDFCSGQVFWRSSPTTLKIQRMALNKGPHPMEQECVAHAINELSSKGEAHAVALPFDGYGSGCADVNRLPDEPNDFASPEVLRHMKSWNTLHSDCGLGKTHGMLMMEARLDCLSKYNDADLCVKIKSAKDWERMKDERGAALGEAEGTRSITKLQIKKSKMTTMLARFECALERPTEECAEVTELARES